MTQPMFKPGDIVVRIDPRGGSKGVPMGVPLEIEEFRPRTGCYYLKGLDDQGLLAQRFKLYDPLEEAKKALEAAGWTLTPPPPKAKGKVYILQSERSTWSSMYKPIEGNAGGIKTIAILDWEEGQGLDNALEV